MESSITLNPGVESGVVLSPQAHLKSVITRGGGGGRSVYSC